MKHIHSFMVMLLGMFLFSASLYATDPIPGYTIFGPNKYGYTDLTSNVNTQKVGTVTYADSVFTGKGLPGRICETGDYLQMSFSAAQTMTLTDKYAIHIKLVKVGTPTDKVQVSFCNNGWNATRVSYEIPNASITGDEVVLKFGDRNIDNWNSYGESNSYGENRSFSNEIFRICAANNEQFKITQIYIKADETAADPIEPTGDEDAPTNLQASVKSVADVSAVITASAEDENAITFKIYNGETVIATGNSVSGVAKDIEVTGLTPETAYTLQVEAKDAANNVNPNKVSVNFTTTKQNEKRYYFVRSGDLPTMDGVTCVDLRPTTNSAWSNTNPTLGDEYASWTLPNNWFASDLKPKAQCLSDVTKANWYLRMKFKTDAKNLSGNNLRINLSNGAGNFFTDNKYGDGEWHDTVYALANAAGTLRSFPVNANDIMFQLHADGSLNGTYFYMEYAYLTNDPTNPEKPKSSDKNPPTNVSLAHNSVSYDRATVTVSATDEESPISYALSYKVKGSADEPIVVNFTGTQGTSVDKEITGLAAETTYTFTLVATDPNGNEADPVNLDVTTKKVSEKRYYFYHTGALPASSDDLTCVDLRKGVGSTVQFAQGGTAISEIAGTNFSKYKLSPVWCFVRVYPTAQTMDDVNGNWYLHMRYKSTHAQDVYVNVAGHDMKSMKIATSATADNLWRDTVIQLDASKMTVPVAANKDAFQIQAPNNATPGTFAIDYAFISNDSIEYTGYVDDTAPTVVASVNNILRDGATLKVKGTDDSDSKIRYTIADSLSYILNSGDSVEYVFTGLEQNTEYTILVNAVDTFGNAIETKQVVFTTSGDNEAPQIATLEVAEKTATSIKLRMMATDNEQGTITYQIAYGETETSTTGAAGEDVLYTISNLPMNTEMDVTVTAIDESLNESEDSMIHCATVYYKSSEFGTYMDTITMYNYVDHKAGADSIYQIEIRVVTYKDMIAFQQKILREGSSASTGAWDNQMWIWNEAQTSRPQELAATIRPQFDTRKRYTETAVKLNNNVPAVFPFNMYASNSFGATAQTCSQMMTYMRGYINQPRTDDQKPSVWGDITYTDNAQKRTINYGVFGETNQEDVFYYVKEGNNEYLSVQPVVVPVKYNVTYECYLVDLNGNISDKRELYVPNAIIQLTDTIDNSSVINQWDGDTVTAELTRSLSKAYYNTLSLPFDVDAQQVVEIMGEGTQLATLKEAYMKSNDELYLGFVFTDHIEAGVPYLVQPAQDVTNPTFNEVVIDKQVNNTEIPDVITFKCAINPAALTAQTDEDHTILMLMANNELTFPSEAGTMYGMRAYFQTTEIVGRVAKRASFSVRKEQTGLDEVGIPQGIEKAIVDGKLVIINNGILYNAQGQRLQ